MGLDQVLNYIEPQASAAGLHAHGVIDSAEALEKSLDVRRRNTNTMIFNTGNQLIALDFELNSNFTLRQRVFYGVVDQVGKDLAQSSFIGQNQGQLLTAIDFKEDLALKPL